MKLKWYISALILTLAVFGLSQEQSTVPNQEILLQFSNSQVDSVDKQSTITTIKQQLKTVGAKHIQVQDLQTGTLKITYYSVSNVASVEALFDANNFELDYANLERNGDSKIPLEKESNNYNLDVYEIQNGNQTHSDLGGDFALELKQDYVRFYNSNVLLFYTETNETDNGNLEKVAYKINKSVAIAIDNFSYKIPEVRAGPIC